MLVCAGAIGGISSFSGLCLCLVCLGDQRRCRQHCNPITNACVLRDELFEETFWIYCVLCHSTCFAKKAFDYSGFVYSQQSWLAIIWKQLCLLCALSDVILARTCLDNFGNSFLQF